MERCGRGGGGRRRPQQRHGRADPPDHDAGVALQVELDLKPVKRQFLLIPFKVDSFQSKGCVNLTRVVSRNKL